jgi:hypothetical protein
MQWRRLHRAGNGSGRRDPLVLIAGAQIVVVWPAVIGLSGRGGRGD